MTYFNSEVMRGTLLPILVSLLLLGTLVKAQEIAFTRVAPAEGNVWGLVTCITQDKQGFMWFSTQSGIYRFDGYQWVNYKNDPANPNSLANNWTESILADKQGFIWVGTFGSGLDRLDPASGSFTHYKHVKGKPGSISNDTVTALLQDRYGTIWAGTHGGLNQFVAHAGEFIQYRQIKNDPSSLSNNQVRALYEDRQGTLWVGCGSPFAGETPAGEGGLNRFDRASRTFKRFLHDPKDTTTLLDNKVRALCEDSQGTFWVGTFFDGLHSMDRSSGKFRRYRYDRNHPDHLSRPYLRKGVTTDGITFIHEDASGSLWIGSYIGGLNRFDLKSKKLTHIEASKDEEGIENNGGWWAFTSREGVLWISTGEGNLYRVDPFRSRIPHIDLGIQISSICVDRLKDLWLATPQGLRYYNTRQGTTERFVHNRSDPGSLSNDEVEVVYEDSKGTIWVGCKNSAGLNRYNRQTKSFDHFRFDPDNKNSLTNGTVFAVYEDTDGYIWVGTTEGLNRLDPLTEGITRFQNKPGDGHTLSNNYITRILQDRAGYLWIGMWNGGGINRMDRKTGRVERFLAGTNISSIYQDSQGVIWTGGIGGLYRRQPAAPDFTRFVSPGNEDVIPSVANITEDARGNLWLSTSAGLIRIGRDRKSLSVYGKTHGVNGNTINYAGFKDRGGVLYFADQTGYYKLYPEQIKGNFKSPAVILTDFRILSKSDRSDTRKTIHLPDVSGKEIRLRYNENIFAFNFVGIHYSSPEENRHQFKLENYDDSWRVAGNDRMAFYYKVPPGEYTFRVRVSNSDGAAGEKSVNLVVSPPWWNTWWSYFLLGLAAVLSVSGYIHWRSRSLKRQNQELEKMVNDRTAEVVAQNAEIIRQKEKIQKQRDQVQETLQELKATQNQLIQKEKMASLGELTAGIAHEIQNPLNFVKNFSEVTVELVDEMERELKAGDPNGAINMVGDVKQNLQKIMFHGKRADSIVKGMQQHSRSSVGLEKQPVDINALAGEYMRRSYHSFQAKEGSYKAELVSEFDEDIGSVKVIPQDLGRVFLNLFENAFYATMVKKARANGQYTPEVRIKTHAFDGKIEIRITDNGTGIPDGLREKIFQPFFTTKPAGQGTGLGLSLSYDIITKEHQGELKVDTKEGDYATFIIQLPANQDYADEHRS